MQYAEQRTSQSGSTTQIFHVEHIMEYSSRNTYRIGNTVHGTYNGCGITVHGTYMDEEHSSWNIFRICNTFLGSYTVYVHL